MLKDQKANIIFEFDECDEWATSPIVYGVVVTFFPGISYKSHDREVFPDGTEKIEVKTHRGECRSWHMVSKRNRIYDDNSTSSIFLQPKEQQKEQQKEKKMQHVFAGIAQKN